MPICRAVSAQKWTAFNGDVLFVYPDGSACLHKASGGESAGRLVSRHMVARNSAQQIFHPDEADGEELVRSTYLLQGDYIYSPGPNLLERATDKEIFREIWPGSSPVGVGGSRLAFLRGDGNVVTIGPNQRIRANPYSLFPKALKQFGEGWRGLQTRVVSYADMTSVTFADVDHVRSLSAKAGWELDDPKPENLGRLADGSVKLVDTDASHRLTDRQSAALDPPTAIPAYQEALRYVVQLFGAGCDLAGGLHLGLGLQYQHSCQHELARHHLFLASEILGKAEDDQEAVRAKTALSELS